MNAYELADKVDEKYAWLETKELSGMLRQQAKRIEELNKLVDEMRIKLDSKTLANYIDSEVFKSFNHPHKELSDEEIKNISNNYYLEHYDQIIDFAKEIIKVSRNQL